MRNRARAITLYWLVQAVVLLALFQVLVSPNPLNGFEDIPDAFLDLDYMMWAAPIVLGLTCMQEAFLRPVVAGRLAARGRRGPCRGALSALAGHIGSAAALSFGISLVLMLGVLTIDPIRERFDMWQIHYRLLSVYSAVFGVGTLVLTPVLAWKYRAGAPVWLSLAVAGLAIAALVSALVFAIMGLFEVVTGRAIDGAAEWIPLAAVMVTWPVATPLLLAFVRRGDREGRLARVASMLFLGTVVETIAVLPLDVVVRRRSTCYCEEKTFWSLVLLGAVGFFALGPVLYLLPFQKRRRRWLGGQCEVCGYDMRATTKADRCPECGAGWRPGPVSAAGPGESGA